MINESLTVSLFVASLWRPILLAFAALVILRACRLRHPAAQHALWSAVLAGMLFVAPASLWMPQWEVPLLPGDREPDAVSTVPPSELAVASEPFGPGVSGMPSNTPDPSPVAPAPGPKSSTAAEKSVSPDVGRGIRWSSVLLVGYVGGVLLLTLYWSLGWYLLRGIRRRAIPTGFRLLRQSSDIAAPVTTGLVRRFILVPADWRTWSREMRHAALAHEIAHIRRADTWTLLLSRCVRCVLWFHPLAWMVARKVSVLAEVACDAVALRFLPDPARYSEVLLAFAEKVNQQQRTFRIAGLAMAAEKDLSWRIHNIFQLSGNLPSKFRRPVLVAALLGIPMLCLAAGVGVGKQTVPDPAPPTGEGSRGEPVLLAQAPVPPSPGAVLAQVPGGPQPKPLTDEEAANSGRIEGMVVSSTGGPVAEANIRLVTIDPRGTGNGEVYSAKSEEDGSFVIENIKAPVSDLALSAEKAGYVRARYGVKKKDLGPIVTFSLRAKQTRTGLVLTMTPHGVISGVITDDEDEPVPGAMVIPLTWNLSPRGGKYLQPRGFSVTNGAGEYEITNLPPGGYLLLARMNTQNSDDGTMALTTFFPNGLDAQSAARVEVYSGQETRGMDVQLRQGASVTVSGTVTGATPNQVVEIVALPEAVADGDATSVEYDIQRTETNPDGTFTLPGLGPGNYVLNALVADGPPTTRTVQLPNGKKESRPVPAPQHGGGRFPLTVREEEITGLTLPLHDRITLTGTVRVDDGEYQDLLSRKTETIAGFQGNPSGGLGISLMRPKGLLLVPAPRTQVAPDGTFTLKDVPKGAYELERSNIEGTYIKAVRLNGAEVGRNGLNVNASGTLEITLGSNAATVTGTVYNSDGDFQQGAMAGIWPVQPDHTTIYGGLRFAATDSSGGFQIQSVTPGTYYLLSFGASTGCPCLAPQFLDQFRGKADRIEIEEGDAINVQPDLITPAEVHAVADKLGITY